MENQPVGFIGLGAMGSPMAGKLLKDNIPVHVYDLQEPLMEELRRQGGRVHNSPLEVAQNAAVIICMLPHPTVFRDVIIGPQGILSGIRPGSVVIDMSTNGPEVDLECAGKLMEKGAHLIDSPVGKGTWAAGTGELTLLVGGDPEVVQSARWVLDKLGNSFIYCGSLGSGQVVKLANNLASCVNMAALAELYVLALKRGITVDVLEQALQGTGADSWHFQNSLPRVKRQDFEPGFKVKLALKDLTLIAQLSRDMGLDLACAEAAQAWYAEAVKQGYGELDWSVIAKGAEEKYR